MTLSQWKKKYKIHVSVRPLSKGKTVHHGDLIGNKRAEQDLFHLSDYLVHGVSGGTVWLAPKTKSNPHWKYRSRRNKNKTKRRRLAKRYSRSRRK